MTPAQVFYVSGSHVQRRNRRREQIAAAHGPNARMGSLDELLAMSATQSA